MATWNDSDAFPQKHPKSTSGGAYKQQGTFSGKWERKDLLLHRIKEIFEICRIDNEESGLREFNSPRILIWKERGKRKQWLCLCVNSILLCANVTFQPDLLLVWLAPFWHTRRIIIMKNYTYYSCCYFIALHRKYLVLSATASTRKLLAPTTNT